MFAGYMWTSNQDEEEDARLIVENISLMAEDQGRTDVRPISPTIGSRQSTPRADPITTASGPATSSRLNETGDVDPNAGAASAAPRLERFVLLGIYADTALVAQAGPGTQRMWPVKIGSLVPGGGRVIALMTNADNPSVLTTTGRISVKGAGP